MQEPRIHKKTVQSASSTAGYVDPRNICNPGFHTVAAPTPQPFSSSSQHHISSQGNDNATPSSSKYRLEAEDDAGDCEYKWKLVGITSTRFEHLVTQMNFRISEGQGKCLYEIGVHDDGTAKGLDDADFEESVGVVKRMAGVLSLDAEIIAVQDVTPTIAELLHEQRQYLASRRTALEGLLSRNTKMMYPAGVGATSSASTSANNTNTYHQPFHFQKQYERRHEELSEALHNIVTQQAAADEQQAKVVATPPTTGTTMIPKSNSNLQQVLAAPLVQPKRMRCAEILVTRRPAQVCDVRVVMCGEEGAGKSTLVGVLTRGELDDGNGAVRSSIFSHRHELFSGKTSTIASHAIGFNAEGFITNYEEETENGPSTTNISASTAHPHEDKLVEESGRVSNTPPVHHPVIVSTEEARTQFRLSHNTTTNNTSATADIGSGGDTMSDAEPTTITTATPPSTTTSLLSRTAMSLAEKSVKLVTLLDIGGSGQYSRTAFFGLTARNPGYVSLVIDVSKMINDEGGMGAFQTSSSTFTTTNQDVGAGSEEMEGGGGVDTCGGFLSEESDCTPPTTTTTAPTMTPMMKRLDSCIGQYIAICCVAKIPFFLILTKVDDVCELEMDDFLYEVDNYISAITGRFDRRYEGDGTDHRQEKEEEESAIKTLVVSVPEHLSHRDLVAGGTSSDPSRKSATETVLRAVIGCVTRSCVPVFLASSVSGAGLGALRAFFHQLPVQYGHQVSAPPLPPTLSPTTTNSSSPALTSVTASPPPPTEVLIEGAFFVPARNVGVVLAGVVLRGSVRVGQHLRLGPDRFGGFYDTTVLSIHTQPDGSYVSRLGEGSDGTFAIGHYGCDFCVSGRNGDEGVEGGLARDVATTTTPNVFELVRGGGVVDTTYAITTSTTTTNNTTNHPLSNFRSGPQDPTSSSPLHSRRGSSPTTTNTREPSTETDVSHESSGKVSCNATFVDQPPPTANPATIRGGDANGGSHLLHPHLIRPIPTDQMPPLTACYQHHKQTSPILNNNASTKRKEALSVAHLVQTFPVSSFFFGRKGTVLVSHPTSPSPAPTATVPVAAESSTPSTATSSPAPPGLCFRFECRLHILPSPHHRRRKRRLLSKEGGRGSPHIAADNGITVGQEPVVHCRNIRQAARIDGVFAASCAHTHCTPNHMLKVCNVVCQFLYFPEVLSLGATVLLRCGQAISAVGTVVLIHPIQQGAIAPKSPTLRAARYPPPMSTSNTHLQLPLLPPPTTSLSTAPMNTNVVSSTAGSNTNTVEDPLLLELMRMEVVEGGGGGDGSLSLFADDDEDKKNRKQPQSQRRQRGGVAASQAPDTSTTAAPLLFADGGDEEVGGAIDPERRRLEHECRRLSRAERRARHYALILSHKNRKEQQQDENGGKKRVSDDLEGGGSSSTATTGMGGRYCSNYSYYSSTATATPPPTPDTTGGSGGTWANYHHSSWHNNPRRGESRGPSPPIITTSTPSTTTTARGADVGTGGSSSGMMMSLTMTASPPQSPDVGGAKASFNMMTGNQPTAEFLCQTDDDDVDMM